MAGMTLDEFLKHQSRGGGGKKKFLGWKSEDPYAVTVWLHPKASILALWRHPFPRVELVEDKQTHEKRREVWGSQLVCLEHEDTLKHRWRNRETGERERPFEACPMCLMVEHVRRLVDHGKLSWVEPVFRFEASDPTKTRFLHAGGLYKAFGDKNLTAAQVDEMKSIPIPKGGPVYRNEAFKQDALSKVQYVLSVVAHEHPEDGVQVAVEPSLLGEKCQEVILKAMKELGQEEGHPGRNPVAFRFEFNPAKDVPFDKKYDVTRMSKVAMTPTIRKLLNDPPPDISSLLEPPNMASLRSTFERHCLINPLMPWDEIFEPGLAREQQRRTQPRAVGAVSAPDVERTIAPQVRVTAPVAAPPPNDAEMVACDQCEAPMLASESTCVKCGATYDVAPAPPPPPPAPVLPKRSTAGGGTRLPPARVPEPSPLANLDDTDEIPF